MAFVVVGVRIIQQPEVNGAVVVQTDIVAVDRTRIGTRVDLGVDVGKVEIRKRDVLVPAYDQLFDGIPFKKRVAARLGGICDNILHYI
jgi:hypothetical protein